MVDTFVVSNPSEDCWPNSESFGSVKTGVSYTITISVDDTGEATVSVNGAGSDSVFVGTGPFYLLLSATASTGSTAYWNSVTVTTPSSTSSSGVPSLYGPATNVCGSDVGDCAVTVATGGILLHLCHSHRRSI